ncbi:GNAT family N-acetyltransferase [Candidatus Uabimicrobium amorphum]|uniref:GNAT family N-acetyltransferase n=1 Tax=Uabimicrobium amorphum TaxID=2596890 RepID=UPI0015667028|nr:GNAT family N-acetyltransferase [Candidatus Uabimicrobium amorphum]
MLKKFCDLTLYELYEILKVRQEVFVIEQQCFYLDLDDKDQESIHLQGIYNEKLVSYLRIIPEKDKVKIGRVITRKEMRGKKIARAMMDHALQKIAQMFPEQTLELAAQEHLQDFYSSFGFDAISDPYDEDGIMHVDMRKNK